jgi:parvulin-like peptidyl-prolyl isomerase
MPTRLLLAWVLVGSSALLQAAPAPVAPAGGAPSIIARVGDSTITQEAFDAAFAAQTRAKFYHGKPPDAEIAALQREVADKLVVRELLLREIERRGLQPDAAAIDQQIAGYDRQYAGSEAWKKNRASMLPALRARLQQDDLLGQIEKSVRDQAQPTEEQVKAYFAAHPEKFTEPAQLRVSVILLKVDPSANNATWQAAEEQARALAARAHTAEEFAALAREYSGDGSAAQGGDMGYLHSGMLPDGSQAALEKMQAGEISEPQRLLEGVALFRLADRKLAIVHTWDEVKVRAGQLAQRDQADALWEAFVQGLKARTTVQLDQSRFLPLDR